MDTENTGEPWNPETTFLFPFNFNFFFAYSIYAKWIAATICGGFGMMFYNDGGEMMEKCFLLGEQGGNVDFIYLAGTSRTPPPAIQPKNPDGTPGTVTF